MIVKSVKLANFRNHQVYKLECKDAVTLILGKNGWGKTSILEAIYIALRGKSFRAVDNEIVKRGEEFYRIEVDFGDGEKCVVAYDGNNKTFVVGDKKYKRLPKRNKYPVVLFLPSDLNLISNSPSARRDYFDRMLAQLDERYDNALSRYDKALKQRNELLKSEYVSKDSIFSWNMLLSQYGTIILNARRLFVREVNLKLTEVYRSIAKTRDEIEIVYSNDDEISEEHYLKKLEQDFERDRIIGHTSFGPHRDDFVFLFNGEEANGSASRGETRSMILAMKFIEAAEISARLMKNPIILLDDVFSELDEVRRKCLVENFKDHQVIITSVEA
jgi:DNA replication and repair protein RecF